METFSNVVNGIGGIDLSGVVVTLAVTTPAVTGTIKAVSKYQTQKSMFSLMVIYSQYQLEAADFTVTNNMGFRVYKGILRIR